MDLKVFKTKRKAEMFVELILSLLIAETGFIMLTRTGIPEFLALGFIGTGIYFAAETLVHDELQLARIHIFIDMDGCIARWETAMEEDLKTKEFYESREMEKNLIEAVKILQRAGFHVTILTAYINEAAKEGKKNWLKEAGLDTVPVIFVPYGEDKSRYVKKKRGWILVLVDDFSKNLHKWEAAGFVGVKFRNPLPNGTKGTWTKKEATVYYYQRPEKIAETIIMTGLKRAA